MPSGEIPVLRLSDFRLVCISDRFGAKGLGAVVRLMLHLAAQPGYRVEAVSGIERELAAYCGVSCGLMTELIAYAIKLGLFSSSEDGAGCYLACDFADKAASKKDENEQPLVKVAQNPENESKTGQILISEGCAFASPADEKKEEKKQKKKEDNNNNLLNKLPYGECKVVYLTAAEHQKLVDRFGAAQTQRWIEKLENYAGVFPKRFAEYASHYRVILTWAQRDRETAAAQTQQGAGYGKIRRLDS